MTFLQGVRFTNADHYIREPHIFRNPWNPDGSKVATWWQSSLWEVVARKRLVEAGLV
jgi:hypothetical protein